jgi:predicted nucleic-acid-binding protein
VKITADTNVLLRAVVGDDEVQQQMAIETLESAELVAISAHSLCEFAWVLDRGYETARSDIASVISHVLEMHNVVVNRPAVEAGLRVLKAGGDFADGVIAYGGNWLAGETFVSFDKRAVSLVRQQGRQARLLA